MKCPDNTAAKLDLEIADMKEKISTIIETLSAITSQLLSMSQQKESFSPIQCTARHSTPMSSHRLCSGSKLMDESSIEHLSGTGQGQRVKKDCFSLFLTNSDGSATEEEVFRMVAQSLDVNETQRNTIDVLKLVPKWKMDYCQQYVSFKVTMDGRLKDTALQSGTWPTGIMFREFVERTRRPWIPVRQERK